MRNDEVNKKDFPEENFSSGRRIFFSYFSSSYFLQKGINICKYLIILIAYLMSFYVYKLDNKNKDDE